MNTQKVAITLRSDLLMTIDTIRAQQGMSRSRFISNILEAELEKEKARLLKEAYDRVFSDEEIRREQLESSHSFDGAGTEQGQEW